MKILLSTLVLAVLTSNVAVAKNNVEISADAQAKAKLLAAQASIAFKNKQNELKITGSTVTNYTQHVEGGKLGYTYKSKTGRTSLNVGAGMTDFSSSKSFGASAGFKLTF